MAEKKYRVCVSRKVAQEGIVVVSAEDEEEARDAAMEHLLDGGIVNWIPSLTVTNHYVDEVREENNA